MKNVELNRRDFLTATAGGALGLFSATVLGQMLNGSSSAPASKPKLNIVYLHSHDTGRYIQPYGYPVPTPNMQRLAQQGVLFEQAFCAGPTCSPSRGAMLTGQCPHSNGLIGLAHRGFNIADPQRHLANVLRRNGYHTALIGVQHEIKFPMVEKLGYEYVAPVASKEVKDVAPAAVEFLSSYSKQQPFFVSIGFFETHRHGGVTGFFTKDGPNGDQRYVRPPDHIPNVPQTRQDMADYIESAKEYDRGVGMILDAIDKAGLAGNTLVINTTDHGVSFPGMKCSLTDDGIGVMLIMRGPGGFTGGKVSDAMVSQIDILPTLFELIGIEKPDYFEGKSLLPLVRGEATQIHEAIFSEVTYHSSYEPMRCVRTERWKYIRRFGDRLKPVLCNTDKGLTKDYMISNGLMNQLHAPEELYDLALDPSEGRNLAADPASQKVLEELRNKLMAWMEKTNDPLLKGPVPAPPGAFVDDPDEVNHKRAGKETE